MTKKLLFSTIIQKIIVVFLLLITGFVNGQTTYDFTTNATLSFGSGGFGIWNTQANITIGGVAYKLTSGGNGSFTNSANGGASNTKCLMKDGSGGDQFTLERVDGQPFQFYGIWVKHQSMNSYSAYYTLPPWYTLNASGVEDQYGNAPTMYTYQDMTTMTAGTNWNNYTGSSITINSGTGGVTVTSVQIQFQAIIYFWIDNIIVGPPSTAAPTVTTTAASSISNTTATLGGNVTADGGASVTERGIVWSTVSNPTVSDNKAANGSGLGTFSGTINSLPPGTTIHYRAYATNSAGTSYGTDMTFTTTSVLGATQSQTNIACNGGTNGSATVSATGGVPGYTYSWSPYGGTGATASGLAAGTYTCTITDAAANAITKTFTITQPTAVTVTPTSQTNVSCNGGANGAARVSVSGGTPGYFYNWTPGNPTGDGTNSVTGLTAGTWTCTITDANSCTATQTFTITQPTAISTATGSQTNVSCNGGSNGSASVSPSGGAGGYTYSWSPSGGTGATASGLAAGTYTVTVTDANSCQATRSFTITQPVALVATASAQTNIACNGGSNGSATVSVTGGTPGYTYSWSPSGGTAATATGLSAGTYTVTVTDANSCTATRSFTITQPTAISTATGSQTNVSCNGGSNGSASVSPSGGAGGYTYSWSPSGGTAATATGLSAGTYTVTVTDANSCSATRTFTITEPTPLIAPIATTSINYCQGATATALSATALTGHTLQWYTVATNGTASTTAITPSTSTAGNTDYYVSQKNNIYGCESPRLAITVNVNPTPVGGTATSATASVCSGSTASLTLAGNIGTIQWQQLIGSTWTDISGETNATLTTPSLTSATSFRAKVTNGSCGVAYSNTINITLTAPPLAPGFGLDFDGSNDIITIPNSATYDYTTSSAFTIEAWVKINSSASSINTIVGKKVPGGSTQGYAFYINTWGTSDRKVVFEATGGTFISTTSIPNNTWTHVAVSVASGGAATIYINGSASGTGNVTIPSNSNTINVGAFGNNGYFYFNGSMDEVRIWNVAKSATELNNSKNNDVSGSPNLALYYKFNEGTAAIVNDKSANGNNGTLSNFALTGSTSNWVSSSFQDPVVITGNSKVCIGATTTLSHTITGGTWSSATPSVATIDPSTGVVTGVAAGTSVISYAYTYNGCSFTTTYTINVNALPVISGTTTVEVGATTALTATTTAATSNSWVSSNTSVATVTPNGVVTGRGVGTAIITYTNNNGCTDTKTVTVNLGTTLTPVLTSPATNTSGASTLQISYTLPEAPLAGSVRLIFTPVGGGTPIVWTMSNAISVNFNYSITGQPNPTYVTSGLALPFTTYTVTLSYQDFYGSPPASVTNTNIQTLAPPSNLSYSLPSSFTKDSVITNITPSITGTVTGFSVSPSLPAGLTLNTTLGVISGTPTVASALTSYLVTAINSSGSTTATLSFAVAKGTPTIASMPAITKTFGDAAFTLTAQTSNGTGAFTYSSTNTSVATISGTTVTIVGAGTATITATQATDANYLAGSTSTTLTVAKGTPTIASMPAITKTFGDAAFTLTAPTSNGTGAFTYSSTNTAVATISGTTVTIVGTGTATITATQVTDANYLAGSTSTTLTVAKATPVLSNFNAITKTTDNGPFTLAAPVSSGGTGTITYTSSNTAVATVSGTTVTIIGVGTATITATQAADTNYNSQSITALLTVGIGTTQAPVLTSPATNTTGATTLQVSYTLQEAPLAGSVQMTFTPVGGGTPIVWTMSNATSVSFAYAVGTTPSNSNIVSGTALAFTTYNVSLSYQDAFGSPAAQVSNTNIQTLAPPNLSLSQTSFSGAVNGNIVPIIIQNTGGAATFSITPALPNGLVLNTTTGVISGLPTVPLVTTSFTVTVSNGAGTRTIGFNLFIDQDTDGDGILNAVDTDDDGDGVLDINDAFPLNKNEWKDTDRDGTGDNADTDDDNDGILDTCDVDINGDSIPDNGTDLDADGINDGCDQDKDGDGVLNVYDNCPSSPNTNQADRDHDGLGDVCDTKELNISQAITPNGDGINDTWMIYNIENHPNTMVRVYNLWGHEVFFSSNYKNDWDGHYNGSVYSLPTSDSYLYQVDLNSDGTIEYTGWLYITK